MKSLYGNAREKAKQDALSCIPGPEIRMANAFPARESQVKLGRYDHEGPLPQHTP